MPTLIISDLEDTHLPFVQKYLNEEPIIIGSSSLIYKRELSISSVPKTKIIIDGRPISSLQSVWYRKPYMAVYEQLNVASMYLQYAESAIKEHISSLFPLLNNVFWVSDYYAIQKASSKPWQYSVAASLGLIVPDTLHTSDRTAAQAFLKSHKTIVIKSLSSYYPYDPQDQTYKMFFTRKVQSGEHISFDGLHLAPSILQAAIDTDFDIRVAVVGNKTFASAIRIQNTDDRFAQTIDWRAGDYSGGIKFEPYKLETSLAEKCIELVRRLGLQFGAIDLVRDKKGKTWFLEINPNGQWAFVDDMTVDKIGQAIAHLLQSHDE